MKTLNLLKSVISYIYYKVSYFYKSLFLKTEHPKKLIEIDVLCRGESLQDYITKDIYKSDLIIICNFEKDDLSKSAILSFISKIPISIISNNAEPIPYLNDLKKIKISEVYISRIKSNIKNIDDVQLRRGNYRLNSISREVKFLNNKNYDKYLIINKKYKGEWNTGLFGLFLACSKQPKIINIFGMDFYFSEYFYEKLTYEMTEEEKFKLINLRNKFLKTFEGIIVNFPDINFNITTKAEINFKSKNLNIN